MNGIELKEWRNRAGMTAKELAKLSGVTTSTISRFEHGSGCNHRNYQKLVDIVNNTKIVEGENKE